MRQQALMARLSDHQESILAIMRGAEATLTDPVLRDVATLARMRWAVLRALTAYQLFKHAEIFDPAIAGRWSGGTDQAQRMKRACLALGEDVRGYVMKWSSADVAAEWPAYQPAALALIARIRTHIAGERREIAGLLALAA